MFCLFRCWYSKPVFLTGEFLDSVIGKSKHLPPENGSGNYIQSPQAGLFVQDGSGDANAICFVLVVYESCSEAVRRTSSSSCLPRLTSVTAPWHCTSDFPASLMVVSLSEVSWRIRSRLKAQVLQGALEGCQACRIRTRAPHAGRRAAAARSQMLLPSCERSQKAMSKPKAVPKGKGIVKGRGRPGRDGNG